MKSLNSPSISFLNMLEKCSEGMLQINVRQNFISTFPTFLQKESNYRSLLSNGNLYTYNKISPLSNDTIVIGTLNKRKLINLYENNLLNKDKPAREYYDALLVSSGEHCPFCGNIGQTRNLDHFLPKAHFPEFSVMPLNLVPSCMDCNMGEKGESYAEIEEDQSIHPYIDKAIFFQEQWIFASYLNEDGGAVVFHVECPDHWRQQDKDRARNYFNALNLAHRYGLEAGKHLSEIIDQRNSFLTVIRKYAPNISLSGIKDDFVQANFQPIITSGNFPNHWKKVMYQCLANSEDFFR